MFRGKKKLAAVLAACIALTATGIGSLPAQAARTVVLSPDDTYAINNGVFEGWGTSLCWWANRVGYSDSLAQKCADTFFGENGLRLNIARFNIGGGDDPSHNHITRTDSNMPGYTKYQNGQVTYDWSADANQRNVLRRCIEAAGDDMIVEMFSNSPPYWMCKSGCSTGNRNAGQNNLKDDCYDDFAEYLAEVCKHYRDDWGSEIQSVEAMNEPYTNYWGAFSPKQEGCHFDIGNSESTIITELQKSMAKRGMQDVIICGTYQMPDYLKEVATAYPDQKYIIFDDNTYVGENQNVLNLTYKQNDMGYLVGTFAACMTTDTSLDKINPEAVVGFVGGVDSPVINDFLTGFIEGALAVNADIKVDTRYTNDYVDTAIAKEYGLSMINDNKCDIVWGVAGNAGNGAAEAALETGKAWFIGVDSDQELTFSPDLAALTLTSGLKNIGNSLIWVFDELDAGNVYWGTEVTLGLAEGGVGIVTDKNFDKYASAETKAAVAAAQEAVLSGAIVVDTAIGANAIDAVALRDSVRP